MITYDRSINAIYITNEIENYWDDLSFVKKQITESKPVALDIFINSLGGDVDTALDFKAFLEALSCSKTVHITGLCASAATVIACTKESKVVMHDGALYMIHEPWTYAAGNSDDLKKTSGILTQKAQGLAEIYSKRTGIETSKLLKMMKAETWLTSAEALEQGFVDEIDSSVKVLASLKDNILTIGGFNFSANAFKNLNIFKGENKGMNATTQATTQVAQAPQAPQAVQTPILNSIDDIKTSYPALYSQIHDSALKQGVEQERARLQALDELETTANKDLITKAKYETFATAEQCAVEIIKAQKLQMRTQAVALAKDANELNSIVTAQAQTQSKDSHVSLAQEVAKFF